MLISRLFGVLQVLFTATLIVLILKMIEPQEMSSKSHDIFHKNTHDAFKG